MYRRTFALIGGVLSLGSALPAGAQDGAGLRLTGVLVSGHASVAIIAGADGREKVYRVGHEIQPGTTLAEVSAHGVLIARNRRRDWLPLVGGSAGPERLAVPAAQAPPRAAEPNAGIATGASSFAEPAERRSKFNTELTRQGVTTPAPGTGPQMNEDMQR